MCRGSKRITPFMKQCFAVSSVVLNTTSCGLTIGFNASLFSELRKTQEIPLDIHSESWLASLVGLTLFIGSVAGSIVMETLGRKSAILMSSVLMICGWTALSLATSFPILLLGKIFQGISLGLGTNVGNILLGEYSSPKYRGGFIATIPAALLLGTLIAHSLGMFYSWHDISKILTCFSVPGLIVTIFSPESPSFLVNKGRYEECRKAFRWLRGTEEEEELETMIKTDMIVKELEKNKRHGVLKVIKTKLTYVVMAFRKREFRIPIIIIIHLNALNQFCGSMVNDMYALDIHTALYDTDIYMFKVITSLDVLRILATMTSIYTLRKLKRRSMLVTFTVLNVIANLLIAGFIYARLSGLLPNYYIAIGMCLHHFHSFIIGIGSLPLLFVIGGEIFPLADRGFCGTISCSLCSLYMFANIKSAPYLFAIMGVEGAFCLYSLILFYSLVVIFVLLPETKDKTLQDIEDEFRGGAVVVHEETIVLKTEETR